MLKQIEAELEKADCSLTKVYGSIYDGLKEDLFPSGTATLIEAKQQINLADSIVRQQIDRIRNLRKSGFL